MIFRIAGREYTTATTDQLLGHSIGPVAGYGVSMPLKVTQNMIQMNYDFHNIHGSSTALFFCISTFFFITTKSYSIRII